MPPALTGPTLRRGILLLLVALTPLLLFALLTPARDLDAQAKQIANEYDRLLNLRRRQVFTIAAFPSIRGFAASTPETRTQRAAVALNELSAWVASDSTVREALITDQSGTIIMTTLEGWNTNIGQRRVVQDALAGQLGVSPLARDRGEYSNYYSAPILNNSGNVVGALLIRVAAQELWQVLPRGADWYAVLADGNGVRLDDSGDAARRLAALGELDAPSAARIAAEQTYGAELPLVRATELQRAQELVTQGALDRLEPADFGAEAIGAQRLVSMPWSVIVVAPQASPLALTLRWFLAIGAGVLLAIVGALIWKRI